MKEALIVCAMEKEAIRIASELQLININGKIFRRENITLLITGIGKQKTAIALTEYLSENKQPDIVVNIGYAGSTDLKIGTWVNVVKVHNYEWNIPGEEKYDMLDYGKQDLALLRQRELKQVECYSAESFVTETNITEQVIFDMELHSIAMICDMKNIELLALKKVTDNLSLDKYYENLKDEEVFELKSCLKYIENYI